MRYSDLSLISNWNLLNQCHRHGYAQKFYIFRYAHSQHNRMCDYLQSKWKTRNAACWFRSASCEFVHNMLIHIVDVFKNHLRHLATMQRTIEIAFMCNVSGARFNTIISHQCIQVCVYVLTLCNYLKAVLSCKHEHKMM